MSSLVPGFEYDIFISYRQNDNRSGWVTEFVNALQEELAATVKEPVTIYFDKNPYDGLLETHSVDKSIEGKLKCLIFIPILSQTYCDPKSFAWQKEFCSFNRLAKEDQFGRDIRLRNGNVASRILPVRIHHLDDEDQATVEKETGGVLRSIDFIYEAAGVARPLKPVEDEAKSNLKHIFYRDQINKVARAVKELVIAMHHPKEFRRPEPRVKSIAPNGLTPKSITLIAGVIALIGLLGFGYYYFESNKTQADHDKSIAILPFVNMSSEPAQEYFSDGMMEELLNQLVKVRALRVVSRTSSMAFKGSKLSLKEIAQTLGVSNIVEGSVRKAGSTVRITVQLIDTETDTHLWSETYDRDLADVLSVQTDIAKNISSQLQVILDVSELNQMNHATATNVKAYDYYLKALQEGNKADANQRVMMDLYSKAIQEDSTFALAYARRAASNGVIFLNKRKGWEGRDKEAWNDIEKARRLAPDRLEVRVAEASVLYMTRRENDKALAILQELNRNYPNNSEILEFIGLVQRRKGLFREAITNQGKALMLDRSNGSFMYEMGRLYRAIRDYKSAAHYFTKSGRNASIIRFLENGDTSALTKNEFYLFMTRKFDQMIHGLDTLQAPYREGENFFSPKALQYAVIYYFTNPSLCKKYALEAVPVINKKLNAFPDDFRYHAALGTAKAYAGEPVQAVEHARKACELMPYSKDTFVSGGGAEQNLMEIYLITGHLDLAMDQLEILLSKPGQLGPGYLHFDPMFDNLRGLPRFEKILKTEYKTVY